MAESPRRHEERLPCDLPAELASLRSGAAVCAVRVLDLGLGGAALEAPVPLQRGMAYELRLRGGAYPARLTWEGKPGAKARRCGVSFTLTSAQEERLRPLLDELRRKPWA